MRTTVAVICAIVMGGTLLVAASRQKTNEKPQHRWIKIVFGKDGKTATWDGGLSARAGRVLDVVEWGLEATDSLDSQALSWKITTGVNWSPTKRLGESFAEPVRGILVHLEATESTVVRVQTQQGNFEVRPADLVAGRPTSFLEGRAWVEALGSEALVAETETDDDFTSIAIGADGHRHVAWIAYDDENKQDHLLVRDVDDPTSSPEPIAEATEFSDIFLFGQSSRSERGLGAVWCSPDDSGNWDLYTANQAENGWTRPRRLTNAEGTDFHLAAAPGPDGSLWLAWQSMRNGNSDIFAKGFKKGRWSKDIPVATTPANEWEPSIAVDSYGRVWVGYDTYEHGNYDVYLVPITAGSLPSGSIKGTDLLGFGKRMEVGKRIAIARSPDFEAHANVLVDLLDRVWVAYDAAGPNWGKDFARGSTVRQGRYAEPLHASRRLGLRCVVEGRLHRPLRALPQKSGPREVMSVDHRVLGEQVRFYDFPQLGLDGDGRLWLFFRLCRQGYTGHPKKGGCWDIFATTFTEKGWLEPIQLPKSEGRQNQRLSFTTGPDGRLCCAWSDGNHFVDRKYTVHHGTLPMIAEQTKTLPSEPIEPDRPGQPPPSVPAPWTMTRNGEEYRLFFGDLHRHTNISLCTPTIDGCLTDAHRYALDAAELDFLAVTDHTRDTDPFPWWRTQKAADLYHQLGRYVTIFAYERSNATLNGGHRNVFFLERGHEVNHSGPAPDTALYSWLKDRPASFTIAHTPGYVRGRNRGTWTFNDPQVEPVAEIFQAYRRSYERPDSNRISDRVGQVAPEASLWYALARGYRLGFIASSDHHSTHLSYACVWAKEKSRGAIFEAIHARRTYAATDRIALEVRIGDALMGEEMRITNGEPTLSIRALGTAPIDELQIVRSGEVIETIHPNTHEIQMKFTDPQPLAGSCYYYVRLHQQDDNYAWGSPIWVRR